MVDRVVLHVGTMKSGTTYLQHVLETGILESVGGFYAGGSFKAQARAVDRLPTWTDARSPKAWRRLAERVQRREGVAFYSHEFLSFAPGDRARKIVESFGGAPVDVVLTVRDQHAAIPAQWQTYVRNRGTDTWEQYVRRLETMRGGPRRRSQRVYAIRNFRRAQDVPDIIRRWRNHPGVTSLGVVLVPPAGSPPQLLWQRFCEAAGIETPEPPDAGSPANPSLGYASCELVRRLNPSLKELSRVEHDRARKPPLRALLPLRAEEARPVLDHDGAELARRLNRRIVRAVSREDVRLVGSTDELSVNGSTTGPASIPPPDPVQVQRALEAAWAGSVPGVTPPEGDLDAVVSELGRRLAARFGP